MCRLSSLFKTNAYANMSFACCHQIPSGLLKLAQKRRVRAGMIETLSKSLLQNLADSTIMCCCWLWERSYRSAWKAKCSSPTQIFTKVESMNSSEDTVHSIQNDECKVAWFFLLWFWHHGRYWEKFDCKDLQKKRIRLPKRRPPKTMRCAHHPGLSSWVS